MAKLKKSVAKKLTKATKSSGGKPLGALGKIGGALKSKVGLGGGVARGGFRGGRGRRKKSAMWYAKEIARLKLKRRYEKVRLRI